MNPLRARQTGGTLMGLVVGIAAGLTIAGALALYIDGPDNPIVSKVQKVNQKTTPLGDPNAPLYSNQNKTREIAQLFKMEEQPASDPADNGAQEGVEAASAAGQAVAQHPVTALDPEQSPSTAVSAVPQPVRRSEFFAQVGAYRNYKEAEFMRGRLAILGLEARISESQTATGMFYRVRVGPFDSLEAMQGVRSILSGDDYQYAIIRLESAQ